MSRRGEALRLPPLQPGFRRPLQPPRPPPDPLGRQEVPVPCLRQDLLPHVAAGPARGGGVLRYVLSPPATHSRPGEGSEPHAAPRCAVLCCAAPHHTAPCRAVPCRATRRHAAPCRAVPVQRPKEGRESIGQDYLGFGSGSPKPRGCSPVVLGDAVPGPVPHRFWAPGRILTPYIARAIKSGAEHRRRQRRKCPLVLPGLSLLGQHRVPPAPAQDPAGVRLPAPPCVV